MSNLRCLVSAVLATALVGLSACGGGGGGGGETAPTPQAPAVARIEVSPAAALLTPGQPTQSLRARAFDADGRELAVAIAWTSSRPQEIAVAADGRVSAASAFGSSQVQAQAGGVRSAPVLVTAAEVGAGVQLLDDAQVVSLPVAVDPLARGLGVEVEVVLAGLATPPQPGALLLGRQGLSVGGEVVSASAEGANTRVRLRLPDDLRRLVARARVNETIDLRGLPLTPAPEVAALYDVQQVGDEFTFTPKPGVDGFAPQRVAAAAASPGGRARPQAIDPVPPLVKHKLGPFECELAEPVLPVNLTNPGGFTIKFEPIYSVLIDENDGLRKIELGAAMTLKAKAALQFNAGALVNLTCEATLFRRLAPLPGWPGLILSGEIKQGFGFEAEGSITLPLVGVEAQLELAAQLAVGIDCTSGDCQSTGRFEPSAKSGWRLVTPDDIIGNGRSEFFVFPYTFVGLKAGATLVEAARIEVFTVRGGVKAETSLAPEVTQMSAPALPGFPDYRSDYKLSVLNEVAAGSINKGKTDLQALLQRLGFFKATLLKWQIVTPLATSPKGSVTVDRTGVRDGDVANFRVKLDPAAAFLGLPLGDAARVYNVRRIRIVRAGRNETTRTVATVEATADQLDFNLSWLAEGVIDETEGHFAAFVDSMIPTPFGLKLGPAVLSTQKLLFTEAGGSFLGELGSATAAAVPFSGFNLFSLRDVEFDADLQFAIGGEDEQVGAFSPGQALLLHSLAQNTSTRLTPPGRQNGMATFSPAADAIAYRSETIDNPNPNQRTTELRRRVLGSGAEVALFTVQGSNRVRDIVWSPDGSRIAVLTERLFEERTDPSLAEQDLFTVRPDGTDLRLHLTAELVTNFEGPHLDWSPDSAQIVLTGLRRLADGSRQGRIVLVDLAAGTNRAITAPAAGLGSAGADFFSDDTPRFSPDGASVAYRRRFTTFQPPSRDDGVGLRVASVDGSADRRIFDGAVERQLGWARDGDAVVVFGQLAAGAAGNTLRVPLQGTASPALDRPGNAFGSALQKPRGANTNLAVELAGASRQEPGAAFSVAVNARNLSAIAADDVRLELQLPPGWAVGQVTGASGCEALLTATVCRIDALTRDAPRAVLVEVRAPELIGEHKLVARIASRQRDSEPANNVAELAVDIGTPRR